MKYTSLAPTTKRSAERVDFYRDRHSSIFHMDGNIVRVLSWYDNVWGFSNEMVDTGLPWGG